jgi:hypothetical protein
VRASRRADVPNLAINRLSTITTLFLGGKLVAVAMNALIVSTTLALLAASGWGLIVGWCLDFTVNTDL